LPLGLPQGFILEFEFGTNWSNYSWFVGDIFGAPLAIEGVLAFFMEATFVAVMFFGWNKVSKKFHLASTWLTIAGATISAYWILVANAWMQYPAGMEFNPDTARNEMTSFWEVALSPVALNKFFHTVLSGWIIGAAFVTGISSWYLLKKRNTKFALASLKIGAVFGLLACILSIWTGHGSAQQVADKQPMKLAAMEGLYKGTNGTELIGVGVLNPAKEADNAEDPFLFKIAFPKMLSYLITWNTNTFVPGITDVLDGGYLLNDGSTALSVEEKMAKGASAVRALGDYREAKQSNNDSLLREARTTLDENFQYFGYGYIKEPADVIPPIGLTFYAFHVMLILGGFLLLLFIVSAWLSFKNKFETQHLLQRTSVISIFLAIVAGQAGWIVAEVGRQPWAIQDILPTTAAISKLSTSSVQLTFFIFLTLFTIMLIAELKIMINAIKKGPQTN